MPNLPNFRRQAMGDVVPAMLEPGEFVINRKAVNALGVDNLEVLNDAGGAHSAIDSLIASATVANSLQNAKPPHFQEGGEVPSSWGQRFVERFPSRHEDPERAVGQERGLSNVIDALSMLVPGIDPAALISGSREISKLIPPKVADTDLDYGSLLVSSLLGPFGGRAIKHWKKQPNKGKQQGGQVDPGFYMKDKYKDIDPRFYVESGMENVDPGFDVPSDARSLVEALLAGVALNGVSQEGETPDYSDWIEAERDLARRVREGVSPDYSDWIEAERDLGKRVREGAPPVMEPYRYGGPVGYQNGGVVPDSFLDHLEDKEGSLNLIYKDSLGLPTGGTGHLMSDKDLKKYDIAQYVDYDTVYGTRKVAVDKQGDIIKLDKATTENWRKNDSEKAYMAAVEQAKELGITSQKMINHIGSVNFQLGTGWRQKGKFPGVWEAMKAGDYGLAAKNVEWVSPSDTSKGRSDWYKDTPQRAEDFMGALKSYVPGSQQGGEVYGYQQGGEVEQLQYREPQVQGNNLMGMSNDRRVMPVLPPDEYVMRQENGEMLMSKQQVPKLSPAYMASFGMETPLSKRQRSLLQRRAINPESISPQLHGLLGKVLLQRLENEPE